MMQAAFAFLASATVVGVARGDATATATTTKLELGPSTFTVPGTFPTSLYNSYYNDPTQTTEQVQPVISDPVSVRHISDLSLSYLITSQLISLNL